MFFFPDYSSQVMFISKKVTKEIRAVTDFRYLNVTIVKNNLVFPLLKDTILMLGSSRCEVLYVLDLKDVYHSLRIKKVYVEFYHILVVLHARSKLPVGLNIPPAK